MKWVVFYQFSLSGQFAPLRGLKLIFYHYISRLDDLR